MGFIGGVITAHKFTINTHTPCPTTWFEKGKREDDSIIKKWRK